MVIGSAVLAFNSESSAEMFLEDVAPRGPGGGGDYYPSDIPGCTILCRSMILHYHLILVSSEAME